jgi:hypothetical protein
MWMGFEKVGQGEHGIAVPFIAVIVAEETDGASVNAVCAVNPED